MEAKVEKIAARKAVQRAIRNGALPHPSRAPCTDCGHVCPVGPFPLKTRDQHEYDHHLGYDKENQTSVEPVCRGCHVVRSQSRGEIKGRPTNHRTEASPVMVRFSPEEIAALDGKARAAGATRSGLIRAAVAAFEPSAEPASAIRQPASNGDSAIRELTVVRDDEVPSGG